MKYIAHRGLTDGPNPLLENNPAQIELALKEGYECEIDLWLVDSDLYLGHDAPTYPISKQWVDKLGLWIHAKNLAALRWLTTTDLEYFWHQNDDYVLTSHNYIWTFPGKDLTQRSVMVMPEKVDPTLEIARTAMCYAICSNFVRNIKETI
jgi:hypothetical protein